MFFGPLTTKITFDQEYDYFTLQDFKNIFEGLSDIDKIHYGVYHSTDIDYRPLPEYYRARVMRLTKESPFYIEIISYVDWQDIFLLLFTLTRKDATNNFRENISDFKKIFENPEELLRSFKENFTNKEGVMEKPLVDHSSKDNEMFLKKFIEYYNSLNEKKQNRLINRIFRIKPILKLIKKINGKSVSEN